MARIRHGVTTPESRVRFLIVTADDRRFVGPVHGSGGEISGRDALRRLLAAQQQATDGDPIRLYEPEPGHVLMRVGACALSDGLRVNVPLVGSIVTQLTKRDSRTLVQMLHTSAKRYANKYVADNGPPDCEDDDITRVLAGCVIKPHPELFPSIRTVVFQLVTEGGRPK